MTKTTTTGGTTRTILGVSANVTAARAVTLFSKASDARIVASVALSLAVTAERLTQDEYCAQTGQNKATVSVLRQAGDLIVRVGTDATMEHGRAALWLVNDKRTKGSKARQAAIDLAHGGDSSAVKGAPFGALLLATVEAVKADKPATAPAAQPPTGEDVATAPAARTSEAASSDLLATVLAALDNLTVADVQRVSDRCLALLNGEVSEEEAA